MTQLKQQPELASLPFDRWQEVVQETVKWGLLRVDPDLPSYLHLQPILPYFLRSRLQEPAQAEVKKAIETAFRAHYDQLGSALNQLLTSKEPQDKQLGKVLTHLEYENLVTAVGLALDAQVSILEPYRALSNYIDMTQNPQQGLELGQNVLERLTVYEAEKLNGPLGAEFVGVIDDIAGRQMDLKQYAKASTSYQKALAIWLENKSEDVQTVKRRSATIYHHLGRVAQEQRQWDQAQQYFQQALQIKIEFNDRYQQAGTYHHLGRVAQEQQQWQQARDFFLQALEIWVGYEDTHYAGMALRSLARLWRSSGDATLLDAVASVLKVSVAEVETLLREVGGNETDEQGS